MEIEEKKENDTIEAKEEKTKKIVILDFETNGFKSPNAISIGIFSPLIDESFYKLIIPERLGERITLVKKTFDIHKLHLADLEKGERIENVMRDAMAFIGEEAIILSHNANFDKGVLERELTYCKIKFPSKWKFLCTCNMGILKLFIF